MNEIEITETETKTKTETKTDEVWAQYLAWLGFAPRPVQSPK